MALSLAPCSPLSLGTADSMASLEHMGEKQLFEKFWKGTFKAVATPRPESIIVASITASRKVISTEATTCQPLKADERKGEVADTKVDTTTDRNGCIRDIGRHKHSSYHRTRCVSFDDDLSPWPHAPKGKKKKRKSERKRKRKRSPSYSLSPVRKRRKKKKKKKSSKKSKRHRYTSKKTKHSSSSLKHKRKGDRKHKKSSRSHTKRRRRYQRSESESSTWRSSSTESSHHLHKSVNHPVLGGLAAQREDPSTAHLDHRGFEWGSAAKSVCKTTPIFRSVLSTGTVLQSKPGSEVLNTTVVHHHTLTNQSKGPQDYDSGNDTSSPPSTKTSISRTNVIGDKKVLCQAPASPEKLKFTDGDNASDSGNSVTSYASLCKPLRVEGGLSTPIFNGNGKSEPVTTSVCGAKVGRPQKTVSSLSPLRMVASSRKRTRANSSSSRSTSSGSSRHSGRYSRSRSLSSARSYSRSPSYSGLRRKCSEGSGRSRGSYSRYSKERIREKKRDPSSCEKDVKHSSQKRSGKRHRRRSYSPMRKRRRDSPSHLEARRITSARKRPIPYFRPSPSSSSRSTSVSSWSSLFTRSRSPRPSPGLCLSSSRSRSRSRSRGRSRSRSYFSYRSYSRSSSWNSIFGRRNRSQSRSRSYDSLDGYSKGKNRH